MTAVFTCLEDAQWLKAGDGIDIAPLHVVGEAAGTAFLRFSPGAVSPAHRHPGGEELFVISGRLRVGDRVLKSGDFLYTPPGGIHDAQAEVATVTLISVPEPIEFL
jgi:quercetin dioxygenase-like cupin family protein